MGFETGDRRQKTEERRKKQFSQRYAEKSAELSRENQGTLNQVP
jgi:hypothetical protein